MPVWLEEYSRKTWVKFGRDGLNNDGWIIEWWTRERWRKGGDEECGRNRNCAVFDTSTKKQLTGLSIRKAVLIDFHLLSMRVCSIHLPFSPTSDTNTHTWTQISVCPQPLINQQDELQNTTISAVDLEMHFSKVIKVYTNFKLWSGIVYS